MRRRAGPSDRVVARAALNELQCACDRMVAGTTTGVRQPADIWPSCQPCCGITHVTVAPPMAPVGSTTRRPPSRWAWSFMLLKPLPCCA